MPDPIVPFDFDSRAKADEQRYRGRRVSSDPVSAAVEAMRNDDARSTILQAGNPDQAARVTRLSRQIGEPPALIEGREDQIERYNNANAFSDGLTSNPLLGWFFNLFPRHAVAAQDDGKALSKVGGGFKKIDDGFNQKLPKPTVRNYMSGLGTSVRESSWQVGLGFAVGGADSPFGWDGGLIERTFFPEYAKRVEAAAAQRREVYLSQYRSSEQRIRQATPGFKTKTALGLYQGTSSLIQMAPGVIASIATRSPYPAVGLAAVQSGSPAYAKYRARGGTIAEARTGAAIEGGAEALGELLPMGFVARSFGQTGAGRFIGQYFAREMVGEQLTTVVQSAADTAIANPNARFGQVSDIWSGDNPDTYWGRRGEEAYMTALGVLVAGTAMGGGHYLVQRVSDAEQAGAHAEAIEDLGRAAEQSTLRQRDPEAYNDMIRHMGEQSGNSHVFVPVDVIREFMQSDSYDGYNDPFSDFSDQINEALETGGDVVLPIEFVFGTLPGSPAWQAIKADVRFDPGGMSENEAQAFDEAMGEVADELEKAAQPDAEQSAEDTLVERVTEKLQNAGFTPYVSRQYAEFITRRIAARAARRGDAVTGSKFDNTDVRQVLPPELEKARAADNVDLVINALRKGGPSVVPQGPTLIEWIAKNGGIWDGDPEGEFKGGDFKAMGLGEWHKAKKGRRKAIRDPKLGAGARGADVVLVDAVEAGYFPELQGYDIIFDAQVLQDAVNAELSGSPRYAVDPRVDQYRAAAEELDGLLRERGLDPAGMSDAELRSVVAQLDEARTNTERALYQGLKISQWAAQVDRIIRGDKAPALVSMGDTPLVLQAVGLPAGPLQMTRAKLAKARREHPEVSLDTWRNLPKLVADPRAVFPSSHDDGSFVIAIEARDANNDPVIVPVVANQQGGSVVLSVYGKNDGEAFIAREVARAQREGSQVYVSEGLADALVAEAPGSAASHAPIASEVPAKPRRPILSRRDIVKNLEQSALNDGPRGRILFDQDRATIELFQSRNLSTLLHELGHQYLEDLKVDAELGGQLAEDWQKAQDWFAANGHTVTDGVIPTEAHELWARGFERYLMEGKAPSSSLRSLFETFRGWLIAVYKRVTALKAPITPEIREVFDRLIATDEEIAAMRDEQRLAPLFADAATAGMTGAEFDAYRGLVEQSRSDAKSGLLEKTMAAIRRRETQRYRDARATLAADVADDVDARPLFRAMRLAKVDKISRTWIENELGLDAVKLLPKGLTKDGGVHPDTIAELAGYATGRQMVEAMIGAERQHQDLREQGDKRSMRQRAIDTETDAEMNRRYGDPLTDGSIEREALEAVHNEKQGEVFAAELRTLSRKTGQRATPYRIARNWARDRVRQGVYVTEASPSAIQRHSRAVAKAGREAEKAMLAGKFDEAFRFKQQQMLSSALLSEAKLANDEVEAVRKRLDKTARQQTNKSIDQDYLDQAHALLEAVDLRPRSQKSIERQGKWEAWAAEREAEGFDIVVPASFEATLGRTHWSRLTVENLLGLDEAVKQIVHLGRYKQTLLDNQDRREFDALVEEAVTGAGNIKQKPPKDLMDPGMAESIKGAFAGMDAALLKMETVFDWLDGGNSNGVFNRVVFRPVADAQGREQDMLKDYYARIKALFEAVPGETVTRWGDAVVLPFIDPQTGQPAKMNRHKLVAMALNIGNEGNLQRLADGYGWNGEAIERYLVGELNTEEWQFVQGVWDTIETLWPEIEGLERRVNGIAPEKVEPREIVTPSGTLRGGYYPAIYDSTRDRAAEARKGREADLFEGNYTRATTRASATKARSEKVNAPILLDLGVINRHLGEVIHDITHREAVMQANRFLTSERVMRAVDNALGQKITAQFRPWVKFVANSWAIDRAGNEGYGKWLGKLRANVTAVGLGLRATTMLSQVSGYSNSFAVVGEKWVSEAIARMSAHPVETFNFVMDMSPEVRNRMDTLDRDIRTELAAIASANPVTRVATQALEARKFFFHGIGYMDRVVSVPTWLGAYNKALAEGLSEQEAVYAGDKAVRVSQGSAAPKDMAAVQRGTGKWGEALKLFTMFYSYFSAQYQQQRTIARDAMGSDARRPRNMPRLAARAFWLIVVPPLLTELIKLSVGSSDPPDDDEWWSQWIARKLLSNALGGIPLARDVFEPAWNAARGAQPFNPQFSPINRALTTFVAAAGDLGKIARGEETKHATKNILEATGYATGLVPGQVASATQFMIDISEGDANPRDFGDWIEGLTTGKIKD